MAINTQQTDKRLTVSISRCDGDGVCLKNCPHQVFQLREITAHEYASLGLLGKIKTKVKGRVKSFVVNPEGCQYCGQCIEQCHERAIRFA